MEVKRGEIWTVAGGADYAGKPRPMVIIQSDAFSETSSITLCGLTTHETDAPFLRLLIAPTPANGLHFPSRVMVDKIATVAKPRLGYRVGQLDANDLARLNRHLKVFFALD
jgi:mRNA interferase MazF